LRGAAGGNQSAGTVLTVSRVVNLRGQPTTSSAILTKIQPPNRMTILGAPENGWVRVEVQGKTGWMLLQKKLLLKRPDPIVCRVHAGSGDVVARGSPSPTSGVVAAVVRGGTYRFSSVSDDAAWVEILGDGDARGWLPRAVADIWSVDYR
jgi:SH3-like domain-containing protein